MASSDDEGETLAESVTNYEFVDHNDEPVSFANLPVQWDKSGNPNPTKNQVFLRGMGDDGMKIYKQVVAWKFDILDDDPEVSVLSKENNWIKLVKPRKVFEDTMIRTILITVRCLHVVKKNPETLEKSLWDHLRKTFSAYEDKPSESDLLKHIPLLKAAIKHDETLSKSKFLVEFLENNGMEKKDDENNHKGSDAKKSSSTGDDHDELDEDMEDADEDESDEILFDSICCICDDGGELLGCEGRCMRSFHATKDAGADSECKSLGLSRAQVKAIQNFLCLNCQHQQHQCFACGKLGSSDKSSGAEVFSCVSATCGYFYHPECVARLLYPADESGAEDLQKKIASGESFTCPAHKCHVCKGGEDKDVHDLHFALCRRCPRAYHRKCLPGKIAFEEDEDRQTRAWPDLLPNNRILIYCLKHTIDEELGTPVRNHIKFPGDEKKRLLDLQSSKRKTVAKRRYMDDEVSLTEKKKPKQMSSDFKGKSDLKTEKSNISDAPRKRPKGSNTDQWALVADRYMDSKKGSTSAKSIRQETTSAKPERIVKLPSEVNRQNSSPVLIDPETRNRIMALMDQKSSSTTLEDIIKQHKVPSTHAYSSKSVVDKTITQGKVEGFVEAIRTALKKLEEGGTVEDAKAVCGPQIINQILKWKNKLNVYLGPFLHGMRYTSFGRHFTKVDKLKEIVEKLHWYIREGDMVVDFCCGSNDFSLLMKRKLEETGKKCNFKNFDVIQPKNDFSFEKRDWMTVRPTELPTGSKLIMGLNPPFGVKAALANKFIDKALEFKPKLVILIVPPETERLDRKRPPYDLVWEDEEKLSGRSFYLPGSVDVNENPMEQWNVKAPLLYLWSRSDWTSEHKVVALKQGHLSTYQKQEEHRYEENNSEAQPSDVPMDISPVRDNPKNVATSVSPAKRDINSQLAKKADDNNGEGQHNHSEKIKGRNKKERQDNTLQSRKNATESSSYRSDHKNIVEKKPSESVETLSEKASSEDRIQSLQTSLHGSSLDYRSGHEGIGAGVAEDVDEIAKRYLGPDFGVRGRTPYMNDLGDYRLDPDVRQILQRYSGQGPDSSSQMGQLLGHDSGIGRVGPLSSSYGIPGQGLETSFGSSTVSTMQRYASRLDELNPRLGSYGPDTSLSRSSLLDGIGSPYVPGAIPGAGFRPGFPPAPPHPYPRHNSSGWLND